MTTQLDSVLAFVGDRAPALAPEAADARVIVVGSGKGGVGTSTAACLLALIAAANGESVLLVDGSDGIGAQHLLLGLPDLADGKSDNGASRLPDSIVPVTPSLSLLRVADDSRVDRRWPIVDRREAVRRAGRHFPAFDLVVVDGGSRLESVLAACESGVSLLVAVTAADRICLAATYALVKAVGIRLGERPVAVLGSRIDGDQAREAALLVDAATRQFLDREVDFAGFLPEDACLSRGIAAGMSVQDAAAGSPAAAAMHVIAERLLDEISSARPHSGQRNL